MATVADLITAAARIAGLMGEAGRSQSAAAVTEGLDVLNSLIDSWKAERLCAYGVQRSTFAATASVPSYAIGSTETWDISRPAKIEDAGVIVPGSFPDLELPLQVIRSESDRARIAMKGETSALPSAVYYDPTVPAGTVWVYPVPSVSLTIVLYLLRVLAEFAATSETLILPPSYKRCLEYNLAVELAARNPQRANISPLSLQIAIDSKAVLQRLNIREHYLSCDDALLYPGCSFDWRRG